MVTRSQCHVCGSSQGYITHDNGSQHCYACGAHRPSSAGYNNTTTTRVLNMALNLPHSESCDWSSRALPSSVLEEYGVGLTNNNQLLFPALDLDHAVLGYQTRPVVDGVVTRDFRSHGQVALFGMHTHKRGNSTLIICEGAADTMSMKVLNPLATCVGVPGTGNIKLVAQQLPWVRTFKSVYIAFDGDSAGREAANKLLEMLPRGRTRVLALPDEYDCNRMLVEDLHDDVKVLMHNAAGLEDDSFLTVKDASEHDARGQHEPLSTGFSHIDDMLGGGLFPAELVLVAGYTGSGKSEITNNVMDNIARSKTHVLYIADEMSPHQTLKRLRAIRYGNNFIPRDKVAALDAEILEYIHIYKKQDMALTDIVSVVERAVAELGVKAVFIDTICGIGNYMAKYTDADEIVRRLNKLSQGNINEQVPPVAIWGVVHTQGSEAEDITISSIRGGSSIRQQATAILGVCKVEDLTSTDRCVKLLKLPRNNDCKRKEPVELSYSVATRKYTQDLSSGEAHGIRQQARRKLPHTEPVADTPSQNQTTVLHNNKSQVPAGADGGSQPVPVGFVSEITADVQPRLPVPADRAISGDEGHTTISGQVQDTSSVGTQSAAAIPVRGTSGIPLNNARKKQVQRSQEIRDAQWRKTTELGEKECT